MFKYNVPFETIIGLKSVNPIVRYINENIPKAGKLVVYYEPMSDNMPVNLKSVLETLKKKNKSLNIKEFICLFGDKIDLEAAKDADMVIVCGTFKLTNTFNHLEFKKDLPLIFLESETSALNAANCIYLENGSFEHCKFNRTIVGDNSELTFVHNDFRSIDTAWMFAISLINLIKNEKLNPMLKANYGACVDFLSWFISFENRDNRNTRKQLIILKKGISCFYNAFNNDIDNEINKKLIGSATNWSEFVINCINELANCFTQLKAENEYLNKLDKYNIRTEQVDDAVYFYTKKSGKVVK